MRGRKPLPTSIHELHGSFQKDPQRRRDKEPEPIEGVPECPEYLTGHAREEWGRIVSILAGMRLANRSDVAALELYCRAYGDWRDACEKVAKLGQVLFTKKNSEPIVRRNPFDIVREKNAALCLKLLTEFGLTPSSRTRCQVQGGDGPDPFAEFLRQREERN
jgi:P27 family predicted phage terminase small subunit